MFPVYPAKSLHDQKRITYPANNKFDPSQSLLTILHLSTNTAIIATNAPLSTLLLPANRQQ
ncbi:hypothetical protein [Endozoicomonas sp. SESOKO1]|uniref:hypothetical protein n=1 Tax=Endozoicomonas sp. SESOKO1 TaxID=2828742 RepID=UPI002148CEFB|nr:hypothetical protein [Endozoicomonas sp. SESOKO1]